MIDWFVATLRSYPELAIFLSLAIGFWIGPKKLGGFSLGNVTATLLAAVAIGQLAITVSPNVKSIFFLLFLFAVGLRRRAAILPRPGARRAEADRLCPDRPGVLPHRAVPVREACRPRSRLCGGTLCRLADHLGSDRSCHRPDHAARPAGRSGEELADNIPIAYAVTYIFGTIGSAIILAKLGPWLLGIDLAKACAEYEATMGGSAGGENVLSARRNWEMRAYAIGRTRPISARPSRRPRPA